MISEQTIIIKKDVENVEFCKLKLREYGYLIWKLSMKSEVDEDAIGNLAYDLAPLVEDWSKDNEIRDSNNVDWIQEPYNDWVDSRKQGVN